MANECWVRIRIQVSWFPEHILSVHFSSSNLQASLVCLCMCMRGLWGTCVCLCVCVCAFRNIKTLIQASVHSIILLYFCLFFILQQLSIQPFFYLAVGWNTLKCKPDLTIPSLKTHQSFSAVCKLQNLECYFQDPVMPGSFPALSHSTTILQLTSLLSIINTTKL